MLNHAVLRHWTFDGPCRFEFDAATRLMPHVLPPCCLRADDGSLRSRNHHDRLQHDLRNPKQRTTLRVRTVHVCSRLNRTSRHKGRPIAISRGIHKYYKMLSSYAHVADRRCATLCNRGFMVRRVCLKHDRRLTAEGLLGGLRYRGTIRPAVPSRQTD